MSICIVDTSVVCNLLRLPGLSQDAAMVLNEFEAVLRSEPTPTVLLPIAVVYETGRHISQLADGRLRRQHALVFVDMVRDALAGNAYWTATPVHSGLEMTEWLDGFPDAASDGKSLADHSIVHLFHRQCALHAQRRVWIWSLDNHLAAYDRQD